MALKKDGSLASWGWNDYGQTDVPSGNQFVAIAAGETHSFAIEVPEPSSVLGLVTMAVLGTFCFYLRRWRGRR